MRRRQDIWWFTVDTVGAKVWTPNWLAFLKQTTYRRMAKHPQKASLTLNRIVGFAPSISLWRARSAGWGGYWAGFQRLLSAGHPTTSFAKICSLESKRPGPKFPAGAHKSSQICGSSRSSPWSLAEGLCLPKRWAARTRNAGVLSRLWESRHFFRGVGQHECWRVRRKSCKGFKCLPLWKRNHCFCCKQYYNLQNGNRTSWNILEPGPKSQRSFVPSKSYQSWFHVGHTSLEGPRSENLQRVWPISGHWFRRRLLYDWTTGTPLSPSPSNPRWGVKKTRWPKQKKMDKPTINLKVQLPSQDPSKHLREARHWRFSLRIGWELRSMVS